MRKFKSAFRRACVVVTAFVLAFSLLSPSVPSVVYADGATGQTAEADEGQGKDPAGENEKAPGVPGTSSTEEKTDPPTGGDGGQTVGLLDDPSEEPGDEPSADSANGSPTGKENSLSGERQGAPSTGEGNGLPDGEKSTPPTEENTDPSDEEQDNLPAEGEGDPVINGEDDSSDGTENDMPTEGDEQTGDPSADGSTDDGASGDTVISWSGSVDASGELLVKAVAESEEGGEADGEDRAWQFTVTLSDTTVNGDRGDMTFINGVAVFALKAGGSMLASGLPAGISYKVEKKEVQADEPENGEEPKGKTMELPVGTKRIGGEPSPIAVGNTGTLTVKKEVWSTQATREGQSWEFTVTLSDKTFNSTNMGQPEEQMVFKNGVATFSLMNGKYRIAEELPLGITYTVEETGANTNGFMTWTKKQNATGTISENTPDVEFVNSTSSGNLVVTKKVTGNGGDTGREWNFTVHLDWTPEKTGEDEVFTGILPDSGVLTSYGDMQFKNGTATFKLKHGESKVALGLPAGATYTVTEESAEGYSTSWTGNVGTIKQGETTTVDCVNTRITGGLVVTKLVQGGAADKTKDWHFTVELSDKSINGKYGEMDFTDGVAEFSIKHYGSMTAEGLPSGIGYEVTEEEANQDGYKTTSEGETGTIPENRTVEAHFTNEKNPPPEPETEPETTPETTPPPKKPQTGTLTVLKAVEGEGYNGELFSFAVKLTDSSINGTFGGMTFAGGEATFQLGNGGSISADGLPEGVGFAVVEVEANQNGYVTYTSGDSGVITAGTVSAAAFVNRKEETSEEDGNGGNLGDRNDGNLGDRRNLGARTGDESHAEVWLVLLAAAAVAAAGVLLCRRKKQ